MKLVDLTCTGCGANVKVDPSLQKVTCTMCGKEMLISRSGAYGEGYDREMGRIQAQKDVEETWKREREEKIRLQEEEKKRKEQKQQMDHIRKQLNIIMIMEAVICVAFLLSPLFVDSAFAHSVARIVAGFVQLGLVASVTFLFTKDRYFTPVVLACLICAVISGVSGVFLPSLLWFLLFNFLKLIWMMRIEHVRYSYKEIFTHLLPGKKAG